MFKENNVHRAWDVTNANYYTIDAISVIFIRICLRLKKIRTRIC